MVDVRSMEYQLEMANRRGVGQFHLFKNGLYQRMTWSSFAVAQASANRNQCYVVNADGHIVYRPQEE